MFAGQPTWSFIMAVEVAGSTVVRVMPLQMKTKLVLMQLVGLLVVVSSVRGMTGWGAKHAAELEVVQSTTDLTLGPVN